MRSLVVLVVASLLALSFASAGYSCVQDAEGEIEIAGVYVWAPPCEGGCVVSLWLYTESNGISGLQVDQFGPDAPCYPPGVEPDSLVF